MVRSRPLTIACGLSFCCFFAAYMRMPVVPLLAVSLGATTVQVGVINATFMVMAALLSIPSGMISDRLGRRPLLLGGLVVLAGASCLLYLSGSLLQMALLYLLFGVGLSTFSPALMSYVADVTEPERLGRAYGRYTLAMYCGMTLGPAAGGYLAVLAGLREVLLSAGGILALMCVVAFFLLPTPSPQHARRAPRVVSGSALWGLLQISPFCGCLIATLGCSLGYGMFVTFMPLYMKSMAMGTAQIGAVFTAQAFANALSRLPTGRLADMVRHKWLLICGGTVLFALALGCLGLAWTVPLLMAVAVVMGGGMGVAFTVICAQIADLVPSDMRGLAVGCYNTCIYTGMLLSSVSMGSVIGRFGFGLAFLATAVLVVASALLSCLMYQGATKSCPAH